MRTSMLFLPSSISVNIRKAEYYFLFDSDSRLRLRLQNIIDSVAWLRIRASSTPILDSDSRFRTISTLIPNLKVKKNHYFLWLRLPTSTPTLECSRLLPRLWLQNWKNATQTPDSDSRRWLRKWKKWKFPLTPTPTPAAEPIRLWLRLQNL